MLLLDLFVSQNKLTDLEAKGIASDISSREDLVIDDLLNSRNITDEEIIQVRSMLYGLPVYGKKVEKNADLMKFISPTQSKQLRVVPLEMDDGVLSVGIVDPDHGNVLDSLQFLFGTDHQAYKVYLITYGAFRELFGLSANTATTKTSTRADASSPGKGGDGKAGTSAQDTASAGKISTLSDAIGLGVSAQEDAVPSEKIEELSASGVDLTDVIPIIDDETLQLPIPELFNVLLRYSIDNGASDIHIEHIGTAVRARIRMDGQLEQVLSLPVSKHPMLVARIKILCSIKLDEKRKPQDGRFSSKLGDHSIDYRVSTFPGYYGEKVVIRILDSYKGVRDINTVGFNEKQLKDIREALQKPYGIILISGPTGSGKTTTLYSMLGQIDREHRNVVSLEDPIEYNMPSMNQSQVFPEIGYTFASGLRSILRQDPDVIMVGEIRDAETASLAIQAALTGHLVFSTIHTNTAIGVVTRLLDMGIEPYLIAPTIICAIGQRLTRKIADGCAQEMEQNESMKTIIQEQFKDLPEEYRKGLPLDKPLHQALPNKDNPTGMKGRVPVFEVLMFNDPIQDAVLHRKSEEEVWQLARANGMTTMKEDAIMKSVQGLVPYTEINEL